MLSHDRIWAAIDDVAKRYNLTTSGLARRAGLDPTTFNPSKRIAADGRERWPSTESVSKILKATGMSIADFMGLLDGKAARAARARAELPPGAAPRPRPGRRRRILRRRRLPRRPGLGPGRHSRPARRGRLCAEGDGQFDAAALSRRRHHHRLADRAVPEGRPGGGQDPRRRSDGEGAPEEIAEVGRARLAQLPTTRTARSPWRRSNGSRGSSGRASDATGRGGGGRLPSPPRPSWPSSSPFPLRAEEPALEVVPRATRNVTPPGVTPGPEVDGPLLREALPPPPPEPAKWRRFFLPETTDAATFHAKSLTIRVSGVDPVPVDRVCQRASGEEWPCGRTALFSLRMFLRGRAIECYLPPIDQAVEAIAPVPGRTDRPRHVAAPARAGARPTTTPPTNIARRRSKAAATDSACGRAAPRTAPARRGRIDADAAYATNSPASALWISARVSGMP